MSRLQNRGATPRQTGGADSVKASTLKLLEYCQKHDWAGYDPYDALNSRVYNALPFLHFRAARLALTQLLKRSPINLRFLLLVPPAHNPKGLSLGISALVRLSNLDLMPAGMSVARLVDKLVALRSKDTPFWCWGYHFEWQSRTALVPRWLPNIICTTFAGNALLDAFDESKGPEYLKMAVSAAEFILNTLYFEEDASVACFSYTPASRSKVHNANLLGAAFLCRVAKASEEKKFLTPALKAARFTVARQHQDGSWDYGEAPSQGWKDNFHTGFNLCALRGISQSAGTDEFENSTRTGFAFFRGHFFGEDGMPKYFHDRAYPVDIHSAAQSIITLARFKDADSDNLALAQSVCQWTLQNMRDEEGYFYFQKHPLYTNKISFMRWSQTWMLLALSTLLEESGRIPVGRTRGNLSEVRQVVE